MRRLPLATRHLEEGVWMNRLLSRNIAYLVGLAIFASSMLCARGQSPSDDEQTLRYAGLSVDGPSLLALVRKHTLTAETRGKIDDLIVRLGADSFIERENASKELFALGRVTLPQLQEASKHKDPEIVRRAKQAIERIEQTPAHHLPVAVLRLLAVRKPAGIVEALLAYVPCTEDESQMEEVRKALIALALRDGKPDPLLVRALSAGQTQVRVMAIQALAKGGGIEGRAAVRKLLKDDAPLVRLRVALALAQAKERDAVPVLIDLLTVLPDERVGEVESALYQLAGDSAPKASTGTEPAEREKCRAAWTAWWKRNAAGVDLGRLSEHPLLGYTLVCDTGKKRVYEIDRHGKERWAIENVFSGDAVVVSGNRVLLAEFSANRVSERDFKGNILWQKQVPMPINVQRLPNGNTFIATYQGAIREVDRAGKEIYVTKNIPGNLQSAYRLRSGSLLYLTQEGECGVVDTSGKRLKNFDIPHIRSDVGSVDLSPNGRILVAQHQRNKVVEYDAEGKKLLEVDAPQGATATGLPNGHILVASFQSQRAYELDRAGKIVWEHKNAGHVYRVRRR
jgi:hypothetical protein